MRGEKAKDPRAEARTLPRVNPAVAHALLDMLATDAGATKPPEQKAALMALLYEMDKQKLPMPRREVLAQVIGGAKSKYTVDAIVNSALAEGYLSLVIETTAGNTQRRAGVRKERFLIPSGRIVSAARAVEKKP